eukprot:2490077-Pyramimonas_sp.AAC.1
MMYTSVQASSPSEGDLYGCRRYNMAYIYWRYKKPDNHLEQHAWMDAYYYQVETAAESWDADCCSTRPSRTHAQDQESNACRYRTSVKYTQTREDTLYDSRPR